jgi:serine/threonine-protein kinase RsbW
MVQPDPDNEATFSEIRIASTLQAAKEPERAILAAVERCCYCPEATFAIKLALEEAMTNAVKHGNCCDEEKGILVRFSVDEERAVIIVRDEGCGFEPGSVPDPTAPDRISIPSGRGIMLMNAYMDEVRFRDDGREVYLVKRNAKEV